MDYTYADFSYIAPPRAEAKIPFGMLALYEDGGWLAQVKKNGTNSVIFVPPDRVPIAYNRHGEVHKAWQFDADSARFFARLPGRNWYVFNAELLHNKVTGGPRNTNYLHDVLVYDGTYLLGRSYAERYGLLHKTFARYITEEEHTHLVLNEQTWLAKSFSKEFKKIFKEGLADEEDEGLVLKNPNGLLSTTDGKGASWMAKCRKQAKNFGF
jgi:ATP dependent DNA ligase-like protein